MKNQKITLISLSLAVMLLIGYIFEIIIPIGIASYVKPSPAEGILIFILITYGLYSSFLLLGLYLVTLFLFKGISVGLIEEIILMISALSTLILFWLVGLKRKNFIIQSIVAVVINSILMTLLNAYWILPSYLNMANQPYSVYTTVFPDKTFLEVLILVITPMPLGGGILHGNLIKYILVMVLAYNICKTLKIKQT